MEIVLHSKTFKARLRAWPDPMDPSGDSQGYRPWTQSLAALPARGTHVHPNGSHIGQRLFSNGVIFVRIAQHSL